MTLPVILGLLIILFISLGLAYRSLAELEVPKEIIAKIKKGEKPPKLWGVILFLKGKTVYYSSPSEPSVSADGSDLSSNNSSKISERIEV